MREPRLPFSLGVAVVPVIIAGAVFVKPVAAQEQPAGAPTPVAAAGESSRDVYIADSAELGERLQLAARLERLGDYRQAGDVYREVLDRLSDKLAPAPTGEGSDSAVNPANTPRPSDRYMSVPEVVKQRILTWPVEARDAFIQADQLLAAQSFDAAAAAGLAGDYRMLRDLVDLHPLTPAGQAAAAILQRYYLESGDFLAAAWLGDDTLAANLFDIDPHPGTVAASKADWLFRTALAYSLAGASGDADRLAAALSGEFADARGIFFGEKVPLVPTLAKLRESGPALAAYPPNSWMTLGGSLARSRIAPTPAATPGAPGPSVADGGGPAAPGAPGKLVRLLTVRFPTPASREFSGFQQSEQFPRLSVFPVIDDGVLYATDSLRMLAADLDSGLPPAGWASTYPGDRSAAYAYVPNAFPSAAARPASMTISDDSIYAIMGADPINRAIRALGQRVATTALVSVNRFTGRESWKFTAADLPETPPSLRNLQLCGTPIVYHNNVFLLARGGEQAQFEDLYLVCVSTTGTFRWARYIVSANSFNPLTESMQQTAASEISAADGRVFVSSNLGVVASVDALSGRLAWVNTYDRATRINNANQRRVMMNVANTAIGRTYTMNPPVVDKGRLFLLPDDAPTLSVFSTRDGSLIKRIAKSDLAAPPIAGGTVRPPGLRINRPAGNAAAIAPEARPAADTLLAVRDNLIYTASSQGLTCIDWTAYNPEAFAKDRSTAERWHKSLPSPIVGRGLLTNSSLIVPTERQLFFVDPEGGRTLQTVPPNTSWDLNLPPGFAEGQGNVMVSGDHIIISAPWQISVFADLDLARSRFLQRIEQSPNLPGPRLRYAESLLAAGATTEALSQLDAALNLLRANNTPGQPSLADTPDRRRLFSVALTAAERILDGGKENADSSPDVAAGTPTDGQPGSSPLRPGSATPTTVDFQTLDALFARASAAASTSLDHVELRKLQISTAIRRQDLGSAVSLCQQILDNPVWRAVSLRDNVEQLTSSAADFATGQLVALLMEDPKLYGPIEAQAAAQAAAATTGQEFSELARRYPLSRQAIGWQKKSAAAYFAAQDYTAALTSAHEAILALSQAAPHQLVEPATPAPAQLHELIARCHLAQSSNPQPALFAAARAARLFPEFRFAAPMNTAEGRTLPAATFAELTEQLAALADLAAEAARPDLRLPVYGADGARPAGPAFASAPLPLATEIGGFVMVAPPTAIDFSSRDRVAVFTLRRGLEIYDTRGPFSAPTKPLCSVPITGGNISRGCWLGDIFVAATHQAVIAVETSTGKVLWRMELSQIPQPVGISPAREFRPTPQDASANQDPIRLAQRNMILLQRAQIEAVAAQDPGNEIIRDIRAAGDTVVVTTTRGRVLLFSATTGRIISQVKVSTSSPSIVRVTPHFIATRGPIDAGNIDRPMAVSLISTATGQHIASWLFQDGTQAPLNIELTPDGLLAMLFPDRMSAVSAFAPSSDPIVSYTGEAANFTTATGPQQFLATTGGFAVASDAGTRLRILGFAPDGKSITPLHFVAIPTPAERAAQQIQIAVNSEANLTCVGTRVVMLTRSSLASVSMMPAALVSKSGQIDPTNLQSYDAWAKDISELGPAFLTMIVAGSDHILALDSPNPRNRGETRIHTINRQRIAPGNREVNIWQDTTALPPLTQSVRAASGGILGLQTDGKLYFLPTARKP